MEIPCAAKVWDTAFDIWRISITDSIPTSAIIKTERRTAKRNLSERNNFIYFSYISSNLIPCPAGIN